MRLLSALLLAALAFSARAVEPQRLTLRAQATVQAAAVRLGDVVEERLPASWAELQLAPGPALGDELTLSRRSVLRALSQAGYWVRSIEGAAEVRVQRAGQAIDEARLRELLLEQLAALPLREPAQAQQFEILSLPQLRAGSSLAELRIDGEAPAVGSGALRCTLRDAQGQSQSFYATVRRDLLAPALHARVELPRDVELSGERIQTQLVWFRDAHDFEQRLSPSDLAEGWNTSQRLAAGALIRRAAIRPTPHVRTGDLVEWWIERDGLLISTHVRARGEGRSGEFISVESPFGGALRSVRVLGPGRVGEEHGES